MTQHGNPSLFRIFINFLALDQIYNFVCNFLDTLTFQVKINNLLSQEFEQLNGVLQGSCLSHTLYLIAINSITDSIIGLQVKVSIYDDDFNFYCSSRDLKTVINILQNTTKNFID